MNKFGCLEGYDVSITVDGVAYKLDSVITVDVQTFRNLHIIHVTDSIIDIDLVNAVYAGRFTNKKVGIRANGVFRGVDGKDYDSRMHIRNATLTVFNMPNTDNFVSSPTLIFEVDILNELGGSNVTLNVGDKAREE